MHAANFSKRELIEIVSSYVLTIGAAILFGFGLIPLAAAVAPAILPIGILWKYIIEIYKEYMALYF